MQRYFLQKIPRVAKESELSKFFSIYTDSFSMKRLMPQNEEKRLELLYASSLLDTLPEADFDDYSYLAAQVCQAAGALISFVDKDREWFKSTRGLDLKEFPRNLAFSTHAILSPELFLVEDTYLDKRFCDHPLVLGAPFIRAYAAAPLVGTDDLVLGTLSVFSETPKTFNESEKTGLQALARELSRKILERIEKHSVNESRELIAAQESRLIETARMATLGEMTSSLFHEINNPLAIIYGKIRKLEHMMAPPHPESSAVQTELQRIEAAAQRITRIIKSLRTFARDGQDDPIELLDLRTLIDQAFDISLPKAKYLQVELIKPELEEAVLLECRGIQIAQILVNIINSSLHSGGSQQSKELRLAFTQTPDWVSLLVSREAVDINLIDQVPLGLATPAVGNQPNQAGAIGLKVAASLAESHQGSLSLVPIKSEWGLLLQLPKRQKSNLAKPA